MIINHLILVVIFHPKTGFSDVNSLCTKVPLTNNACAQTALPGWQVGPCWEGLGRIRDRES